jgi:type II secretory pathway pseudopilin PulG
MKKISKIDKKIYTIKRDGGLPFKVKQRNMLKSFNRLKPLNKLNNINGVTLIELIISVVISLLVLAAASFILLSQSGVFRSQNSISAEQQNLNVAYNKLKYSFRLAGFDYGSNFFYTSPGQPVSGAIPPVQIVPADYPAYPFAALITNFSVVNNAAPCFLTEQANTNAKATSAEFTLGQNCNISDFQAGQLLSFQNPVPVQRGSLPSGNLIFCIKNVQNAADEIQLSPGNGGGVCPNNPNPIPPQDIAGGDVSILTQTMFYWGNTAYNFNSPFNQPGGLYECQILPAVALPAQPPVLAALPSCYQGTAIRLDSYITNFSVTPTANPWLYNILLQGETNTVISNNSPNYSVDSKYNPNSNSSRGYNIDETLNSNVFLRNAYYGS